MGKRATCPPHLDPDNAAYGLTPEQAEVCHETLRRLAVDPSDETDPDGRELGWERDSGWVSEQLAHMETLMYKMRSGPDRVVHNWADDYGLDSRKAMAQLRLRKPKLATKRR